MERDFSYLDPLIREVLAEFGDAYFYSENLHRELCHGHAFLSFDDPAHITLPRLIEVLESSYATTLGQVIKAIEKFVPSDLNELLKETLNIRNFMAHRFWFERVHLMYSEEGLLEMIDELAEYKNQLVDADRKASEHFKPLYKKFGIEQELINKCLIDVVEGQPPDPPFPQRKLKSQETIIHVWITNMQSGNVLLFETEDNTIWQLCDVGLGWSYHQSVNTDWIPYHELEKYLPAIINPRPKRNAPWDYEFEFIPGVYFWVKPGKKERTIAWGVKEN